MSDVVGGFGKVIGGDFGNVAARAGKTSSGSEILDAGQLLIAGMRLTTGWGRPDPGDAFGQGAAGFTGAGHTVDSASPREGWAGTASRAYATANGRQSSSAAALAVLDRDVQTVVAREAFQVDYHRGSLDEQSDRLSTLGYATWSLALIPGVGKALKAAVEMTAVNAAMILCGNELANLASETGENAAELRRLADGYSALTRKTAPPTLDEEPMPVPSSSSEAETDPDVVPNRTPEPAPRTAVPSAVSPPAQVPDAAPAVMHCAPATDAPITGQAAPPAAASADPMAGVSSVFGAVGGAIGSAVAPLAAAMTAVVTAAGQALSTATSAQPADPSDGAPDAGESSTDEEPEDEPAEPAGDDDVAEPTTQEAVATPGEPAAAPAPPVAEPPRAPAPAATRPPQ